MENPYLEKFTKLGSVLRDNFGYVLNYGDSWQRLRLLYSFAIPSDVALEKIKELSPIVEVGAGSGYWAYLLSQLGCKITAYDLESPKPLGEHSNAAFEKLWFDVKIGGPEVLSNHTDDTLFLCWPPLATSFAADCLKNYKGETVVYIGEWEGGCTADFDFFKIVKKNWKTEEFVSIPTWDFVRDGMYILKRNS